MSHDLQQRLNFALLALFSLSIGFFRFQGLNGISAGRGNYRDKEKSKKR
jgi:hypothetical protein